MEDMEFAVYDGAHGKEVPPVAVSVTYLQSYMQSLELSRRYTTEEIIKGKMLLEVDSM